MCWGCFIPRTGKGQHGRKNIDNSNLEKLHSFAYSKGIKFNTIYEQLLKEDCNGNNVVLFHGAKKAFSMPIDFINNSKINNDFGIGFYLGETFEQAANYISFIDMNKVYCFNLSKIPFHNRLFLYINVINHILIPK